MRVSLGVLLLALFLQGCHRQSFTLELPTEDLGARAGMSPEEVMTALGRPEMIVPGYPVPAEVNKGYSNFLSQDVYTTMIYRSRWVSGQKLLRPTASFPPLEKSDVNRDYLVAYCVRVNGMTRLVGDASWCVIAVRDLSKEEPK